MSGVLAGKVALVTGSAGGIGAAVAASLGSAGAEVAVADVADVGPLAELLGTQGTRASAHRLDVGDDTSIRAVVAAVSEHHGGLDILVNAAGLFHAAPLLEVTREDWCRVLDVNLVGLAAMMQAAAPAMIARGGGRIVNLASIGGRRAEPKTMVYSASKAAVISVTQAAALEFVGQGIRVNAIAPGPVLTDMWRSLDRDFSARYLGEPEGSFTELARSATPDGRLATPDDIAAVALFLCSPASEHLVGQTINVDGGVMFA